MNNRLQEVLVKHGISMCDLCGRTIDEGDIAWNEANTEAGTPVSIVVIQCQRCDEEVAYIWSWLPWIDDLDDAIEVIDVGYK